MIPFVRIDNGGMAAFHIVLRHLTLVGLHFLFQEIDREGFLEQRIALVLFVLQNAGDRGLAPFFLAAR